MKRASLKRKTLGFLITGKNIYFLFLHAAKKKLFQKE
jgi:hypothetical protein